MKITKLLAEKNENPYGKPPVTIGFLGDSVTNGCFEVLPALTAEGEKGHDVTYDPEAAYPAEVRRMLTLLYPRAQINVINAGISGDNAPNGLKRMDRDLLRFSPDLTVVCYGLNDCGGGREGVPRYRDALSGIVRHALEAGGEVILMTPSPICTRVHTQLRGDALRKMAADLAERSASGVFEEYMNAARGVAAQTGVPLCDCNAKWKRLAECGVDVTSLLANYLNHPVREMHRLFAVSLLETMFA